MPENDAASFCPPFSVVCPLILSTLNARYAHSSLALRCLYANLHELRPQARIMEFVIQDQPTDVAERLLQAQPLLIGFSVYIWNVTETVRIIRLLRQLTPELIVVLGGPEVSHAPWRADLSAADYIVQGEGEVSFYRLCRAVLAGERPPAGVIQGQKTPLAELALPYPWYSDQDIQHRCIYVEASRGCPFRCEFCLSSVDKTVRYDDVSRFLAAMEALWQRGARNFRFIDRTFNLNMAVAERLLDFFLAKDEAYFLHFEMIPDHFPEGLKARLRRFPPTSLQLEIGIQTLNPEVARRIQRPLKMDAMQRNLQFLVTETHAHMHLDLIVGLPGEDRASFGRGLDMLVAQCRSEIQIGILKKLSGTALARHDAAFAMIYDDAPPYALLQNADYSFAEMQHMKRFARFWNLYYNNGNFRRSIHLLWPDGHVFTAFDAFTSWLYAQTHRTWKISLDRLARYLFDYLQQQGHDEASLAVMMIDDFMCLPGRKLPAFLRPWHKGKTTQAISDDGVNKRNIRQQRHVGSTPENP